jgi:hypothetical protein
MIVLSDAQAMGLSWRDRRVRTEASDRTRARIILAAARDH